MASLSYFYIQCRFYSLWHPFPTSTYSADFTACGILFLLLRTVQILQPLASLFYFYIQCRFDSLWHPFPTSTYCADFTACGILFLLLRTVQILQPLASLFYFYIQCRFDSLWHPFPSSTYCADFTACGIPFLLLCTVQILQPVASLSYFYIQCKDSKSYHHESFQIKQDSREKKKRFIYTCKIFLSICLSDLVPLENQFCSPVFAGINLNFMHTTILRNGSFPHLNSKFCRFCRKYYLNVSLPLCYHPFVS